MPESRLSGRGLAGKVVGREDESRNYQDTVNPKGTGRETGAGKMPDGTLLF